MNISRFRLSARLVLPSTRISAEAETNSRVLGLLARHTYAPAWWLSVWGIMRLVARTSTSAAMGFPSVTKTGADEDSNGGRLVNITAVCIFISPDRFIMPTRVYCGKGLGLPGVVRTHQSAKQPRITFCLFLVYLVEKIFFQIFEWYLVLVCPYFDNSSNNIINYNTMKYNTIQLQ